MFYTEILNKNRDFLNLYKKGRSIVSKSVVIYVKKNGLPYNRFGITAGKKVGNAVMRNRAKRIIRQAYRENEILFPLGIDIIFVARKSATEVKSDYLSAYIRNNVISTVRSIFDCFNSIITPYLSPIVSSTPIMIFRHCTAAPLAPLPKLSRREQTRI